MPSAFRNRSASASVLDHASVLSVSVAPSERPADFAPISMSAPTHPSAPVPVSTPTPALELAPEPAAAAQRAVEAVLTAAERCSSSDRQSVDLRFSVGGSDLSVRVELRADAVHATFRTDSPELRTALAQEWQAVNAADSGDRSLRLASPAFTTNANSGSPSSDSPNASAFAGGDGSSRQRDSGARRASDESIAVAAARVRARDAHPASGLASADSLPSATSSSRLLSPSTSQRLHAHA